MAAPCPLSFYLHVQILDIVELVTGPRVAVQKVYLLKAKVVDF